MLHLNLVFKAHHFYRVQLQTRNSDVFKETVYEISSCPLYKETVYEISSGTLYKENVYEISSGPLYKETVYEISSGPLFKDTVYEISSGPLFKETVDEISSGPLFKETVYEISSGPLFKETDYEISSGPLKRGMSNSQQYSLNIHLNKKTFFPLFMISNCVFYSFLLIFPAETKIQHFSGEKNDDIFYIFAQIMV